MSELPAQVWDALVARGERRFYDQGATLFLEGDRPGPVIAVIDGQVRAEASHGRVSVVVGLFGSGSLVGEVAAIDGLPRSATVVATRRAEVAAIDGLAFNDLMAEHPSLAMWVLQLFAARLRATTARVERAASDVEARLAAVLVELARTDSVPIGTLLMLKVHHGELADLVAADPEDTSRALANLHAHGWVLPGRDSLHIVNVEALAALAG